MLGTVLVSGGGGFAGRHLLGTLQAEGRPVAAPSREEVDFRNGAAVRALVAEVAPVAIFHLAAFSSPSRSWEHPQEAMDSTAMSLSVLEAARHEAPQAAVVLVGSSQAYGTPAHLPATEETPLRPENPYATSKAASDMLGRQYASAFGLRVVRLRPFNHAGPGQSAEYVVSSLCRQVAAAEVGGKDECRLRTGNPRSKRDFTDVRDVVRAYILAAELDSGAFNVCSGRPTSVSELIEIVRSQARIPVRHEVDASRLRAGEALSLFGSPERLVAASAWDTEIELERTVLDTLDWWREHLAG